MAKRTFEVELIGDDKLSRTFQKAKTEATAFGKTTEHVGKQVETTKQHVEKFHASLFKLSAVLLGAGGVEVGLKSVIEAASSQQAVLVETRKMVENLGFSWQEHGQQIEGALRKQRELTGFTREETMSAFGNLLRATKDVNVALKDNALAADIARSKHMDLNDASLLVVKAQMGMTGLLRRQGIDIQPVRTAMDALTDSHKKFTTAQKEAAKQMDLNATKQAALAVLQKNFGGVAEKYGQTAAGAQARFKVALQETEATLGMALLPTVTKYLTKGADWLNQMEASGKMARYAKTAVEALKGAVAVVKQVVEKATDAFKTFSGMVGGTKHAVELLTGAAIAWKLKGAVNLVSGLVNVGNEAKSAKVEVRALRAAMLALGGSGIVGALGTAAAAVAGVAVATGVVDVAGRTQRNFVGTGGQEIIRQSNGQWYISAGRGGLKPITAAQARPMLKPEDAASVFGSTGSSSTRDQPGSSPGGAKGTSVTGIAWSGDHGGLNGTFKSKLAACVAAAGGIAINVTSGKRSDASHPGGPVNMGAHNSNHLTGHAADGTCTIGGRAYPLGNAPLSYGQFGLRAGSSFDWNGAPDIYHVDDGTNVGGVPTVTPTNPSLATILASGTSKAPKKPVWHGLTPAGLTTEMGRITATLRGSAGSTDPVIQNARAHIKALEADLHLHMGSAELAKDNVALKRWSDNLRKEIAKNAKAAATAASEAKKQFDRALSLDTSHILRSFDRAFGRSLQAFDQDTASGLLARGAVAQTPEEKALADFLAGRNAADQAKSRANAIANASSPDEVAALTLGFSLDDQQAALEAAAAASRVAADKKAADAQQAYQDLRDQMRQDMQDTNDDQRTALQNNLDDWTAWLDAKTKSWSAFVTWLGQNGFDTVGLINPNSGTPTSVAGAAAAIRGKAIPMAAGGIVTSPTLALVGESGPEAVIPLGRGGGMGGDFVVKIGETEFLRIAKQAILRDAKRGGTGIL